MSNIYQVDEDWVREIPQARKKRLLRDLFVTVIALAFAWYINLYFFIALVVVGAIFWLAELWTPSKEEIEDFWKISYIEIKEEGLLQVAPNAAGTDTISVAAPWASLRLKSVDRDGDNIKRIKLLDLSLPKGMQTIAIENYKNMSELLNEIEKRLP